jgi:hypothetical protein
MYFHATSFFPRSSYFSYIHFGHLVPLFILRALRSTLMMWVPTCLFIAPGFSGSNLVNPIPQATFPYLRPLFFRIQAQSSARFPRKCKNFFNLYRFILIKRNISQLSITSGCLEPRVGNPSRSRLLALRPLRVHVFRIEMAKMVRKCRAFRFLKFFTQPQISSVGNVYCR